MGRIVSRRNSGLGKWRFSNNYGKPCGWGHNDGRYRNGNCITCARQRALSERKKAQLPAIKAKRATEAQRAKAKAIKLKRAEFHKKWKAERQAIKDMLKAKRKADLIAKLLS